MIACGGRDRVPGSRGAGSPTGEVRDSGSGTVTDGGPGVDAGTADDGGVVNTDGGGPVSDGGGTPTPLDRSKSLSALSPDEVGQLCTYVIDAQGTEVAECFEGEITIEPTIYSECINMPPSGTCTVGQILDCYDSIQGDPCNLLTSTECQALQGC
jgi:hypothetical protein